jgi:hypothetical protein
MRASVAILAWALGILPAHAQFPATPGLGQDTFVQAPGIGLKLNLSFGGGRSEVLLNGITLRHPEQRQSMSCPAEGSCAGLATIMVVAGVLAIALINSASKNNDR